MLENILNTDNFLFYSLNTNLSNSITDTIMPIITHTFFWMPFFAIFCLFQLWNAYKKKQYMGLVCIFCIIFAVAICDQISSKLIKELVQRPRPCHILNDINLLINCGAGKSFPSSHAANSMAAVIIFSLFYRKHKYWLPFLSILVGLSRIFVGVHYPLDVLVGWILGLCIGVGIYFLIQYFLLQYLYNSIK
jgi:undecaprenyl-diphosphatase